MNNPPFWSSCVSSSFLTVAVVGSVRSSQRHNARLISAIGEIRSRSGTPSVKYLGHLYDSSPFGIIWWSGLEMKEDDKMTL
jgi:hypothetical protein